MRLWRILLDPQGGEGGTGGTNENKGGENQGGDKGPDLVKAVEGLVAKHGDSTAALRVLLGENYAYRDQLRDARAKLPGEGAVVLTGDDAKHWGAYREFGAPAEVRKALDQGKLDGAEVGTFRKAEVVRKASEVTTIDGSKLKPTVLGTLARGLEIVVVEEKAKDGKAVQVARVKGKGDETTPLAEYAAKHWGDFLPSLKAEPTTRPLGTPSINRRPEPVKAGSTERPAAPTRSIL